jgi:cell wall-associated NlpC family hydrolase
MKHRHWSRFALVALVAATCGAAAAPAAATPGPGPAATAKAYLQARAAGITATDPGAELATWTTPAGRLAASERAIARGTALRAAELGHQIDSVASEATVLDTVPGTTRDTATVSAHVVTTIVWHAGGPERSTEASGIDHIVSLQRVAGAWQVVGDSYLDDLTPAYLEAAGASPAAVRRAVRRLERVSARPVGTSGSEFTWVAGTSGIRRYTDILTYNRDAAASYADRYALSYNPGYVRFGADCANFASQGGRAGGMPVTSGDYSNGWWYNGKGTSSTSDDIYSLSWINVPKQMGYWTGSRTDWVSSIGGLGKGDFVYYDWSGDGAWDHVAVVVGTNSAGQKVVDAHTTDYYHTYWKMGYSSTRYKYARVRAQWVV